MAETPKPAPWWAPDIRAWATAAMFALAALDLCIAAFVSGIDKNELFKTISTLLWGTGAFGLVCAFLWGGSKASVAAADSVNEIAKGAAPAAANAALAATAAASASPSPQPVVVTNPASDPVQTEEAKPFMERDVP